MNEFLQSTIKLINLNGVQATYVVVNQGTYNIETGTTVNTETEYPIVTYKKHLLANQYNFPNLIGKDSAIFYIANNNLPFTPSVNDYIKLGTDQYQIESQQEFAARSQIVLYKLVGVKG